MKRQRPTRPEPLTEDEAFRLPKYTIGVVSKLVGLPPQMLRRYEESGLLEPSRQDGKNRLYSDQDVAALEEIASLTDEGVNAAGIRHILQMRRQIRLLQEEIKVAREKEAKANAEQTSQEGPGERQSDNSEQGTR
ncbi:MAG TPA: MerR family transcriptional regulator [Ktedonobacteraceae bacterium]|jgi:DNA-binding transcriptional MerR regulator|nr:MerR family transcriptional regulator [Ktedonobacteraceae bacterium]